MTKTIRNLINKNQDNDIAITSDNNQIITFKALKNIFMIYQVNYQVMVFTKMIEL